MADSSDTPRVLLASLVELCGGTCPTQPRRPPAPLRESGPTRELRLKAFDLRGHKSRFSVPRKFFASRQPSAFFVPYIIALVTKVQKCLVQGPPLVMIFKGVYRARLALCTGISWILFFDTRGLWSSIFSLLDLPSFHYVSDQHLFYAFAQLYSIENIG